ncbi:unnamed protein product [Trichobilharzia regenti]|nr:unnamed protein product [Trichobilharzia regenti]
MSTESTVITSKARQSTRRIGVVTRPDSIEYENVEHNSSRHNNDDEEEEEDVTHKNIKKKHSLDTQIKLRFNFFRLRHSSLLHSLTRRKCSQQENQATSPIFTSTNSLSVSSPKGKQLLSPYRVSPQLSEQEVPQIGDVIDEEVATDSSDIFGDDGQNSGETAGTGAATVTVDNNKRTRSNSSQRVSFATQHLEINLPDDTLSYDENTLPPVNYYNRLRCDSHSVVLVSDKNDLSDNDNDNDDGDDDDKIRSKYSRIKKFARYSLPVSLQVISILYYLT